MPSKEFNKLVACIEKNNPEADLDLIRRAYDFAEKAHEGQVRASGEPHINHSLATAELLAEWSLPAPIIAAGILHDTPEDTDKNIKDIEIEFGKDIAKIVEGETKLDRIKYTGVERYVENLRKLFLAMAQDVRVVFVKFADRIHNLSTIDALPQDKKVRIARESLEIYAPIAGRLGMGEIKSQLEDLSFPHVNPKDYEWLKKLTEGKFKAKEASLEKVQKQITNELKKANIPVTKIYGRTKHIYSLFRKLLKYNRDLSKVYDLVALRVIVPDIAACYATLGILHSVYKPLKGRIKDYIATPKPNGYQSLHTTVFADDGEIVEFQIRTEEMHEEAEYGIAAHWRYDEHGKKVPPNSRRIKWMQELAKIQKELAGRQALLQTLEELKIDIFQNHIFVFTPKGDVIDLPDESTPIDFAYAIHTDIGNQCNRAIINGAPAPITQKLVSGDIIEIVVDKNRKGPKLEWAKVVKTRNARHKIKSQARRSMTKWIGSLLPSGKKKKSS
ncbi:MAG: GTP pyrophosphokinase [Parcubacteria group bacterium GW2011_GWC2_39_14]|nr:MAG: GTP pyrophosphokinase [Parcubacteria group bacterium GW2011_GWC2_39_14]